MIRDKGPILLIPAAWILTFATLIYPGLDTYWIQHMHYFMLLFLAGFTVLSWKRMGQNPVLNIWKYVIGAGIVFTGLGALSFLTTSYSYLLAWSSVVYWFLAPAAGLHHSAKHMDEYSSIYEKLGIESVFAFAIFVIGIFTSTVELTTLALAAIAASQTASIVLASKMDS